MCVFPKGSLKKLIFLADMSAKGGGGPLADMSAKNVIFFGGGMTPLKPDF